MSMIDGPRDEDGDIYILDSPTPEEFHSPMGELPQSEDTHKNGETEFQRSFIHPTHPSNQIPNHYQQQQNATQGNSHIQANPSTQNGPQFNKSVDSILSGRSTSEKTQKTPIIDFTNDDDDDNDNDNDNGNDNGNRGGDDHKDDQGNRSHSFNGSFQAQPSSSKVFDVDKNAYVDSTSSSSASQVTGNTSQHANPAQQIQNDLVLIDRKFKKCEDLRSGNSAKAKVLKIKIDKKKKNIQEYEKHLKNLANFGDETDREKAKHFYSQKIHEENEKLNSNSEKFRAANRNLDLIQQSLNKLVNRKTAMKIELDKLRNGLNHTPSQMATLNRQKQMQQQLIQQSQQPGSHLPQNLAPLQSPYSEIPSGNPPSTVPQSLFQATASPYSTSITASRSKLETIKTNVRKLNKMLIDLGSMFTRKAISIDVYNIRREAVTQNLRMLQTEESNNNRLLEQLKMYENGFLKRTVGQQPNAPLLNNLNINTPSYSSSSSSPYTPYVVKKVEDDEDLQKLGDATGINPTVFGGVYSTEERESIRTFLEEFKTSETEVEGETMTPEELTVNLMKHQRLGLHWLLKMESSTKKGGLLADEMGLGKTLQMVSLVLTNRSTDPDLKTTVVVAPVSLLDTWQTEFETKVKDSANIKTLVFHDKTKVHSYAELKKYDVVFVSYHTLRSELTKTWPTCLSQAGEYTEQGITTKIPNTMDLETILSFKRKDEYFSPFFSPDSSFYRIILDEGQQIKNKLSKVSKTVCTLISKYRWILTGTPIQNNISDLFSLVRFLRITPYNREQYFMKNISRALQISKGGTGNTQERIKAMQKVNLLLAGIMLRRTKNTKIDGQPILELPPKTVTEDVGELSGQEKEFYMHLETKNKKIAQKLLNRKSQGNYSSILALLMRLRQACLHSELVLIGEAKAAQARIAKGNNFENDYVRLFYVARHIESPIVLQINNFLETDMTCHRCGNPMEVGISSVFTNCGHLICSDCITTYIDDCVERGSASYNNEGHLMFPCHQCESLQNQDKILSFKMYDQVVNQNYSISQLREEFDLEQNEAKEQLKNGYTIDFDNLESSPKVDQCLDLIRKIVENDPTEKVLIFSQFTTFFDILQHFIEKELRMPYLRYDGSMNVHMKSSTLKEFQRDARQNILLISMGAGNSGLTLTAANHVIIADPFWNPFVEEQAMGRAHRISQTKEVFIHRLLVKASVEDRIVDLQEQKQKLVGAAMDNKKISEVSRLGRQELGYLFGLNGLN